MSFTQVRSLSGAPKQNKGNVELYIEYTIITKWRFDMKRSIIWTISHDNLQSIINESSSVVDILRKLGYSRQHSGNHKLLTVRMSSEHFDMSLFDENKKQWRINHTEKLRLGNTKSKDIFSVDSSYDRKNLKAKLIKENIIPYSCSECGNNGIHNGKQLSLQLDHVNGISNDNRIENLRFLCPNCHSQTVTYASKSLRKARVCSKCGDNVGGKYRKLCDKCRRISLDSKAISQMKFNVSKDELTSKLEELEWNFSAAGRHYGVSDNAIRKRCLKYGVVELE